MADWQRVKGAERYALQLVTPRGTYFVSRAAVMGRYRFTAWPPKPPEPPRDKPYHWQDYTHFTLGCFDDVEAAKRCCEQHAGLR